MPEMGMNDLLAGAQQTAQITNQGMQAGTNIAQSGAQMAHAMQSVENLKTQNEAAKDNLETAKFTKALGMMHTLAGQRPEVAKKMLPGMQDQLRKSGVAFDPGVLELMASDEGWKNRMRAIGTNASDLASNTAARAQFFQALNDVGEGDKALTELGQVNVGKLHADALMNATGNRNSRQDANIIAKSNREYDTVMGPSENGLSIAKKAIGLLDKIDTGKLKGNNVLSNDISSTVGTLTNPAFKSTVYASENNELKSAYAAFENKWNWVLGKSDTVIPPDQLKQLRVDVEALRDEFSTMHHDKFNGFIAGQPDISTPKMQARFNATRKTYGLDSAYQADGAAAAKSPGISKMSKEQISAATAEARAQGYSDQEIEALLKGK